MSGPGSIVPVSSKCAARAMPWTHCQSSGSDVDGAEARLVPVPEVDVALASLVEAGDHERTASVVGVSGLPRLPGWATRAARLTPAAVPVSSYETSTP